MGQRLVVDVYKKESDDEPFCKIYFHWSAYSISCYQELIRIYDAVESVDAKDDEDVIKALMSVGMYPSLEDEQYIKDNYGIEYDTNLLDRNEGLISFTDESMSSAEGYMEGKGSICLETGHCTNDCFFCYDNDEMLLEAYSERDDEPLDISKIKKFSCCPDEFDISEAQQLIDEANDASNLYVGQYDGIFYELIA